MPEDELIVIDKNVLSSLREKYGELLTLSDVASVLKYSSIDALRKARSRGQLPVALYKMPNKRGLFAKSIEVAECISKLQKV